MWQGSPVFSLAAGRLNGFGIFGPDCLDGTTDGAFIHAQLRGNLSERGSLDFPLDDDSVMVGNIRDQLIPGF